MVVAITIKELLEKGIDLLGTGDYLNPLLDAQLLLCHVLNVDKIHIYTHGNELVTGQAVDKYLELINKRKERYPLQYILGSQEFMGLNFYVEEGVLIPRPDTEALVESIIELTSNEEFTNKEKINIVDVGTGSGAITLSLAHYINNSFIYSIDISESALKVAKTNASSLKLDSKVEFLMGNLLEPLKNKGLKNKIDILVSNPPYIPSSDIDQLQREVSTYEPRLALDGGADGLDFYRQLIEDAGEYLVDNGMVAFEIGYNQGNDIKELLRLKGFVDIVVKQDLAGKDRVVVGRLQ